MSRIALTVLSCALAFTGCASTASTQSGRQDIYVPHGEFDTITVTAPAVKQVHCAACNSAFAVRLVRGEATSPQDISLPQGESFGPIADEFDATVQCPMCQKMVDVRIHRHAK